MTYVVKKQDGTTLVEVTDNTTNTSACSVALLGRGAVNYGAAMAENLVHLLENFAADTAPTPPLTGQLWFDKSTATMKFYDSTTWQAVGSGAGGGVGGTVTIGANSVSVLVSNGNIVGAVAHVTIANASLPTSATVGGATLPFKTRFPGGLLPGLNLATDGNAYMFRGTATSANYADLAERYATSEPVAVGDLVEIGGEAEIMKTQTTFSAAVFGVISGQPAVRMNEDAGSDETHPFVALAGRVPVKVVGRCRKGDRMVSSAYPGVAMAAGLGSAANGFTVFGRALSNKFDDGIGLVEVVVGVK